MGLTFVSITISNPADPDKKTTVDCLIDSGAVYSVIPKRILNNLKIKPEETRQFTLANGEKMKRAVGIARFQMNGKKGGTPVVFGEKKDSDLLGATALEAMGMTFNTLTRELLPLLMIIG